MSLRLVAVAARLNIGILQFTIGSNKDENLKRIRRLIERNERAISEVRLLVLPEYSMLDPTGLEPTTIWKVAEDLKGPWLEEFRKIAVEYDAHIVATLFEKSSRPPLVYNTAVLLSPKGDILEVYRKTHLFDAYGYKESEFTLPGDRLSRVIDVDGFKTAISICFELRFPEIFRTYALEGAELVVIPAAWYKGPLKEETLAFLARARAHENVMYVALSALYGDNFTGRSMLVDPMGVIIAEAGIGDRLLLASLDKDELKKARSILPLLKLRRGNLYRLNGHVASFPP